jgi:hypothetical protein
MAQERIVELSDGRFVRGMSLVHPETGVPHAAGSNINGIFREAFESYTPNGERWAESKASGDLVFADGNAASASYLVVSKDPLAAGTETTIELQPKFHFAMPVEIAFGAHMSQRTLGQEFAVEVVDTDQQLADVPDLEIASISQTASTLTIDTVLPHKLSIGKSIGVRDCSDSRANYPSLVVAQVPTPNQLVITAGPGGNLQPLTIANPAGAKGFVYFRERFGRANNGVSQIFENTTVTNASLYVRSESGDALPSGTIAGNHSAAVGTTASTQLINSAYTYAFTPSTEYRLLIQSDRVQWPDSPVDSVAEMTGRLTRTQVCPNPDKTYKLRIRATNNKALTVPIAQIVSVTKTGSTTATVVLDRPVSLTLLDQLVGYGPRDQANFPNLVAATAITQIIDSTTIQVVWGATTTGASFGGYIAKVNGGNLMSALGASAVVVVNAVLTTLSDGTRQLVLTGSTNWAGLLAGDVADSVGVRNNVNGASLGVDGPWKVANVVTTSLTLVLPFAGQRALPADFASTDCGGGVIKRTDLRVSFGRVYDYERLRVEALARPAGDAASGASVVLKGGSSTANQGGAWTVSANQGTAAAVGAGGLGAWPVRGVAVRTADIASAAITGTQTSTAIDVSGTTGAQQFTVDVTAATGTGRRLYPRVQESFDGGATFVTTFDLAPIDNNTDKTQISPVLPILGTHLRYVRKLVGTSPSFTNSVTRTNRPFENPVIRRQLVDSVVSLLTTTPSTDLLWVEGCTRAQILLTLAAATTVPTIGLQLCDGDPSVATNWYTVAGVSLVGSVNSTVVTAAFDLPCAKFARLVPTAAGSVITADTYTLMLKAWD